MVFSTRRGRPKQLRPERDTGTPELTFKRLFSITAEAVDVCLERGLISPEQHWCAIHLRWLHSLRYGAPGARTIDPTHMGGRMLATDDPKWRTEREKELHEASLHLRKEGLLHALLKLCVYNERPAFLDARNITLEHKSCLAMSQRYEQELAPIRHGLEMLTHLWCIKKPL